MRIDRLKGHLDLLLLSALSHGARRGYAVITELRERTGGLLDLTEGSVYPALHKLEDRGLLASEWVPVAGRRRRLYRLTTAGRASLAAERTDWRALVAAVEGVLRPAKINPAGGQ